VAYCQIIGVGGSIIKSIRTESGASVEIQRQELMATSAEHREIYLTGKAECVEAAEKLIWYALPLGDEHRSTNASMFFVLSILLFICAKAACR